MNVSHEYKTIWWAPERCGTKALAHIFTNLGFEFYDGIDQYRKKNRLSYQSHKVEIPEELSDYKVIFSTRNPYDRVLSLFNNFTNVGKRNLYLKDEHNKFVVKYQIFLNELFSETDNRLNKPVLNNYILRYSFDGKVPDMILRMENMIEDLSKIDFIRDSSFWTSGYIHDYLQNNQYIVKRPYKFNSVYTWEGAKLVYESHIKHFILCGYDPFSFTTETLSNEDKMKFIHDKL